MNANEYAQLNRFKPVIEDPDCMPVANLLNLAPGAPEIAPYAGPGRLSRVELVRVGHVEPHPALYTQHLEVTRVHGLPIVVGKGEFTKGDIAIYVPVGTWLPSDKTLDFIHQHKDYVVRTRRFRGVESCGVLLPTCQHLEIMATTGARARATTACWNRWLDLWIGSDVSSWFRMRNPA